jgi:SHS2 domain-containing protein
MARAGHRLVPHTADLTVAAWAPSREECLAEAVRGLVGSFADTTGTAAERRLPFTCRPGPDAELLVCLLEEVIYLLDTLDAVPVGVVVAVATDGGLTGHFDVADRATVRPVGPAPKAITRHGLRIGVAAGAWRCTVTIDV